MAKIFLTGATGYVGGTVLSQLASLHPDWHVTALVRKAEEERPVSECHPNITVVVGGMDDSEILSREVVGVDVVLNLATFNHLPSVKVFAEALKNRKASGSSKAALIQISGASLLAIEEVAAQKYGYPSSTIWNDVTDADKLREWIKQYPQREVDNYILDVPPSDLKTALIIPPLIYGEGIGPGNRRSTQFPDLARSTLERGKGVVVGEGESRWANVHVEDVAAFVVKLAERAVEGQQQQQSGTEGAPAKGIWNQDGVYLIGADRDEKSFGEISRQIASIAHAAGYIATADVESIDPKTADALTPKGAVLWGTNARFVAQRAKDLVGWTSQKRSIEDELKRVVEDEAKAFMKRIEEEEAAVVAAAGAGGRGDVKS